MPAPITAGLAPNIVCSGGYVIRVTAVDATTGATVANVTVSDVSLQVDTADADAEPDKVDPFTPLFVYAEPTT